jgi:hypothetical protein
MVSPSIHAVRHSLRHCISQWGLLILRKTVDSVSFTLPLYMCIFPGCPHRTRPHTGPCHLQGLRCQLWPPRHAERVMRLMFLRISPLRRHRLLPVQSLLPAQKCYGHDCLSVALQRAMAQLARSCRPVKIRGRGCPRKSALNILALTLASRSP